MIQAPCPVRHLYSSQKNLCLVRGAFTPFTLNAVIYISAFTPPPYLTCAIYSGLLLFLISATQWRQHGVMVKVVIKNQTTY